MEDTTVGTGTTETTTGTETTTVQTGEQGASQGSQGSEQSGGESGKTETIDFTEHYRAAVKAAEEAEALEANTTQQSANTDPTAAKTGDDEDGDPTEGMSTGQKTRWQKQVEKERQRGRDAYHEEVFGANGTFSWAKDVDPKDGSVAVRMLTSVRENPTGAMTELVKSMVKLGRGQEAQAWALDILGLDASVLQQGKPTAKTGQPPKGSVETEQGQTVLTAQEAYELVQSERAALKAEVMAELRREYGPLVDRHQQDEANRAFQEKVTADNAAYDKEFNAVAAEIKALPYFEEYKAEIGAELAKVPKDGFHTGNIRALMYQAYAKVVPAKLHQGAQGQKIADIKHKAQAGSVSPSVTGTPARFNPETNTSLEAALDYYSKGGK